jgi:hypothetical protein
MIGNPSKGQFVNGSLNCTLAHLQRVSEKSEQRTKVCGVTADLAHLRGDTKLLFRLSLTE